MGAMENNAYEHLVYQLEGISRDKPAAFRLKVLLISGLAYAVLFLILVAILGFSWFLFDELRHGRHAGGAIRAGIFLLPLLPIFWVSLRAFLVRLPPPEGRPLTRAEAPRLFELIEKTRRKLKGPRIHQVLLNDEYNAAICQIPRLGMFGWHRNYLIIGLPYLLGTPTREAVATLAHEYGHLVGEHGRLGSWIYRQRRTFAAVHAQASATAGSNWINALMAELLDRFAPYYNAYTFVLSRQQEYEADAVASKIVGDAINASGLVRDTLLGRWIDDVFWPRLYAQADSNETPRFMPYAAMPTAFVAGHDEWATQDALRAALKQESGALDTHPCLRERLEALVSKPVLPKTLEHSAAETLLGAMAKTLVDEFDQRWWETHGADWQKYFHRRKADRDRLAALGACDPTQLSDGDLFDLALLQYRLNQHKQALPTLDHLLQRRGGPWPRAEMLKGKLLLRAGDERGLALLLQALRVDHTLTEDCLRAGYRFLAKTASRQVADAWVEAAAAEGADE